MSKHRVLIADDQTSVRACLKSEFEAHDFIVYEAKDVDETINKPVYARVPNDFRFVSELLDLGRPAAVLEDNNPVRVAIQTIARRIVGAAEVTKRVRCTRRTHSDEK